MKTVDNHQFSSLRTELSEAEYLENTIKRMVEELKAKNCLSQDFNFLTKAERDQAVKGFMDAVIKIEDHPDHQGHLSSLQ